MDFEKMLCTIGACRRWIWLSFTFITAIVCSGLIFMTFSNEGTNKLDEKIKHLAETSKLTQCKSNEMCLSKECVQFVNFIRESINKEADPCEDFFSFACGNYVERAGNNENDSVIDDMRLTMKTIISDLMDKIENSTDELKIKLRTVYNSCISYNGSEVNVKSNIIDFLNRLGLENWPHLSNNFTFIQPNLEEVLGILDSYDEFAFFKYNVYARYPESNSTVLNEFIADFGLPLVEKYSEIGLYEDVIRKILYYYEMEDSELTETWKNFNALETLILNLTTIKREQRFVKCDANNTEAEVIFQNFLCNVTKYFSIHAGLLYNFSHDHLIVNSQYSEFRWKAIFNDYNHKALADYLMLRFFLNHMEEMNLYFRKLKLPYAGDQFSNYRILYSDATQNKKELCTSWIAVEMTQPLAIVYLSEVLPFVVKEDVRKMFTFYLETAKGLTAIQTWIQHLVRTQLFDFLTTFKLDGDREGLSTYSAFIDNFSPSNDDFFRNMLEIRRARVKSLLLSKIFRYLDSGMFDANAIIGGNKVDHIYVRFGLLNSPFYDYNRPRLLNLATIGSLILHELGHGVAFYLEKTKDVFTKENLVEKEDCLKKMYSEFTLEKIQKKVKGSETYRENIADLIAIEIIDKIMNQLFILNQEQLRVKLPSLSLNMLQLIYVSIAQFHCGSRSIEREELAYTYDVHAVYESRVNGMVMNSKGFQKAFNCSSESKMNSSKKCSFFD